MEYIKDFDIMTECLCDHDKCPKLPKPKFLWPNYHKDVSDINNSQYRGIPLVEDVEEARRTNITRYMTSNVSDTVVENVTVSVEKQLIALLKELLHKLKSDVYDEEDLNVLKKVRFLTDLKGILTKVKARGAVIISTLDGEMFVDYAKSLCHTIKDIPLESLQIQYKHFFGPLT